jgi:L-lactate dehydrogenase
MSDPEDKSSTTSARFCRFGVDAQHVHAYVIGEDGDSEVLTWSLAAIAGTQLEEFARMRGAVINGRGEAADWRAGPAGHHIITHKGVTYRIQGVAGCEGVTLGLPHLVGGQGVLGTIPLPLEAIEQEALERSASILDEAIESLKLT